MKAKIVQLEGTISDQSNNITTIEGRVDGFENIIGPGGANLSDVVEVILSPAVAKINEQIESMTAEFTHKFG